jgi:hypothetical protein
MTDTGAEMKARALEYVIDNRPAPLKCDYCGLEQSTNAMASGMATSCQKNSSGHCYTFTINTDYEGADVERLAAFAAKEVAREREACAKAVCTYCRSPYASPAEWNEKYHGWYHKDKSLIDDIEAAEKTMTRCVAAAIHTKAKTCKGESHGKAE